MTLPIESLPELGDRIQELLCRWPGAVFTLHSSPRRVQVVWSDGPSVPMVRSALAPISDEISGLVGADGLSFDRNVTRPYLCAAIEHLFGTEGVGPELAAAAEAARLDEARNPSMDGLFVGYRELRRHGWSNPNLAGPALPFVRRVASVLEAVDLSDRPPLDVLRPGVPGTTARVELLATLSRDAGVSHPAALVLWAAALGYPAADSLTSGGQ